MGLTRPSHMLLIALLRAAWPHFTTHRRFKTSTTWSPACSACAVPHSGAATRAHNPSTSAHAHCGSGPEAAHAPYRPALHAHAQRRTQAQQHGRTTQAPRACALWQRAGAAHAPYRTALPAHAQCRIQAQQHKRTTQAPPRMRTVAAGRKQRMRRVQQPSPRMRNAAFRRSSTGAQPKPLRACALWQRAGAAHAPYRTALPAHAQCGIQAQQHGRTTQAPPRMRTVAAGRKQRMRRIDQPSTRMRNAAHRHSNTGAQPKHLRACALWQRAGNSACAVSNSPPRACAVPLRRP